MSRSLPALHHSDHYFHADGYTGIDRQEGKALVWSYEMVCSVERGKTNDRGTGR